MRFKTPVAKPGSPIPLYPDRKHLYKQFERAFEAAFVRDHGRPPTITEVQTEWISRWKKEPDESVMAEIDRLNDNQTECQQESSAESSSEVEMVLPSLISHLPLPRFNAIKQKRLFAELVKLAEECEQLSKSFGETEVLDSKRKTLNDLSREYKQTLETARNMREYRAQRKSMILQ